MYVCICVHVCIYALVWNVCIQACVYMCVCMYICTSVRCMYTGMCVMCACMWCVCANVHTHMHARVTVLSLQWSSFCSVFAVILLTLEISCPGYRGAVLHFYSFVLLRRCCKTWNQGKCNILASTFITKHNVHKIHLGFCVSVIPSFCEQPSAATQYPGVYSAPSLVSIVWVVLTSLTVINKAAVDVFINIFLCKRESSFLWDKSPSLWSWAVGQWCVYSDEKLPDNFPLWVMFSFPPAQCVRETSLSVLGGLTVICVSCSDWPTAIPSCGLNFSQASLPSVFWFTECLLLSLFHFF